MKRIVENNDLLIELDLSSQQLLLDIPPEWGAHSGESPIFPTRTAFLEDSAEVAVEETADKLAGGLTGGGQGAVILEELAAQDDFVSGSLMAYKAAAVEDGLRGLLGEAAHAGLSRFFGRSWDPEAALLARLAELGPVSRDGSLADFLYDSVRDGKLSLQPEVESSAPDYQLWALEALISPTSSAEAVRLQMTEPYLDQIEDLYRGVLTGLRDNMIDNSRMPTLGASWWLRRAMVVRPWLSVEPLPTYYLRRALAFRFTQRQLEAMLGRKILQSLHRPTVSGPAPLTVLDELSEVTALFYGAALQAAEEIGLPQEDLWEDTAVQAAHRVGVDPERFSQVDEERDAATLFRNWAAAHSDLDLDEDARRMIPIRYDAARGRIRAWMFLGWSRRPLSVRFGRKPTVVVRDRQQRDVTDMVNVELDATERFLAYPVCAEAWVGRILDRAGFQALCNRHQSCRRIIEHLP